MSCAGGAAAVVPHDERRLIKIRISSLRAHRGDFGELCDEIDDFLRAAVLRRGLVAADAVADAVAEERSAPQTVDVLDVRDRVAVDPVRSGPADAVAEEPI